MLARQNNEFLLRGHRRGGAIIRSTFQKNEAELHNFFTTPLNSEDIADVVTSSMSENILDKTGVRERRTSHLGLTENITDKIRAPALESATIL